MRPEATRNALLYVSEYGGGVVDVFTFPRGQLVGELQVNGPEGECADAKGDVFITALNTFHPSVLEFAHGGTSPIQTLSDSGQEPYGCAVDPLTGNLVVANESGGIAVYQNAQGSATLIGDPNMALGLWVGFDNQGNLFFDGLNSKITAQFDEMPKGKTTFTKITLDRVVGFPGNIQWDGSHMTLGDDQYKNRNTSAIYELSISGSAGTVLGTTKLRGSEEVYGTWIQGKRVVAPEDGHSFDAVDVWNYPAGGNARKDLNKSFNGPFGAVVSKGT